MGRKPKTSGPTARNNPEALKLVLTHGLDCMSPPQNEATHPRCCDEGYPDGPGRASNKEGESWIIIPRPLSEPRLRSSPSIFHPSTNPRM
jgi:hypothetical protein